MKYLKRFENCDDVRVLSDGVPKEISWESGRGWGSDMTAWDSKNPFQWRQAKYQESMSSKLNEDPDSLKYKDDYLSVGDNDAIPFALKKTNRSVFIGRRGTTHSSNGILSNNSIYPGRLWLDSKAMSFWVYPPEEDFKKIIDYLEKKLGIKIWNNGWVMEVLLKEDTDEIYRFEEGDDPYYHDFTDTYSEIIPIEEYVGSEDVPEEQKAIHLMNWEEKQELKKKTGWGRGWGSDMTAWDSKNPLQWRQAKYQESIQNDLENLEKQYNDKERAKKDFDWFYELLKKLDNGGYLYRIIFLTGLDKLNQELGEHWTHNEEKAKDLIHNLYDMLDPEAGYDKEEYEPYLVTVQTKPDNIDIDSSMNNFCNIPYEEEVNIIDINKLKIISVEKIKTSF